MLLAPIVTKQQSSENAPEFTDTCNYIVGFEVLTAVSVKIPAFRVVTLCSAETT
jgi:hypothetical protein